MARWLTFALSLIGLGIGIWAVSTSKQKAPEIPLAREASVNPYTHGVAALGIIEPAGREVGIVAPEPGLVMEVFVNVGDQVDAGAPLMRLDTRRLEADLIRAEAAIAVGQTDVDRWHALPRAEDVPPMEAAVTRSDAMVRDREDNLRRTDEAVKRNASSTRDLSAAQFSLEAAKADLIKAQADLARTRAGGWAPDLAAAEASLAGLQKDAAALRLLVDRLTVRAPKAGVILRRDIEPGEYAVVEPGRAALILGDVSRLYVRAQVDEEDIALVHAGAKAIARTRGAAPRELSLTLLRIEPYARAKTDLRGINTERVDTRVVDVVFEVTDHTDTGIYPGVGVDVFIDAAAR